MEGLCAEQATGEFIFAAPGVEVHVYLQQGRIAWGVTSEARFLFRRQLAQALGLGEDALKELVEDCRRLARPLGEVLVERGLMSLEEVRAALRLQVEATLASLARCDGAPHVFLPRGETWLTYDARLTFDLGELVSVKAPGP